MNALMFHRWTLLGLRLAVGAVLVYAGISKSLDLPAFADNIQSFRALPELLINLLALTLPTLEILTGSMLILGWQLRVASLASLLMTCIFALAIAQGLARGLTLDCGCFGSGKPSLSKTWMSLARDLLLLAASGLIYFAESKRRTETSRLDGIAPAA